MNLAREYLNNPEVADAILELRNQFKGGFQFEDGIVRSRDDGMADYDSDEPTENRQDDIDVQSTIDSLIEGTRDLEEMLDILVDWADRLLEATRDATAEIDRSSGD